MKADILKLRNRKFLTKFSHSEKLFTRIQLNKNYDKVCWERWVSKDKIHWINWNLYLSLKDVIKILNPFYKTSTTGQNQKSKL